MNINKDKDNARELFYEIVDLNYLQDMNINKDKDNARELFYEIVDLNYLQDLLINLIINDANTKEIEYILKTHKLNPNYYKKTIKTYCFKYKDFWDFKRLNNKKNYFLYDDTSLTNNNLKDTKVSNENTSLTNNNLKDTEVSNENTSLTNNNLKDTEVSNENTSLTNNNLRDKTTNIKNGDLYDEDSDLSDEDIYSSDEDIYSSDEICCFKESKLRYFKLRYFIKDDNLKKKFR